MILKSVARKIIALERKFFWGGDSENKKLATLSWKDLEALVEMGELGFGNIKLKNLGLLIKWWISYSNENDALWKILMKS